MAVSGENTLLMMETVKSIVSPGGELGGRKHRWRGIMRWSGLKKTAARCIARMRKNQRGRRRKGETRIQTRARLMYYC